MDAAACTWVQSDGKKCGACAKKCTKGAVHLDAKDEVVELKVGNVIVATGYDVLDARSIERYGYGTYPNVLTSLEFERLTNASGPTGGKIVIKTKRLNKKTKAEEWVFDAGGPQAEGRSHRSLRRARAITTTTPTALASAACTRLKFAHLVREKLPTPTATSTTSTCARSAKATRSSSNALAKRAFSGARTPGQHQPNARTVRCLTARSRSRPPDGAAGRHGAARGRHWCLPRGRRSWRKSWAFRWTRRMVQRTRTITPSPTRRAGLASTSRASARDRRTFRTRWRRPRRRPPRAAGHRRRQGSDGCASLTLEEIESKRRSLRARSEECNGSSCESEADRRPGTLRRRGRLEVLSVRQLQRHLPVSPASQRLSAQVACVICRWAWKSCCAPHLSPGSATTAASARSSARATPSPARP